MPVALFVKDPFTEAEQLQAGQTSLQENVNVRRPLWGMQVKDPRFAYIALYQALSGQTPTPVSLIDSSAPGGTSLSNHNFILQSVQEARQEKVQIIETFGDAFSFFYGQKPIILAIQGMLLDSGDFNWKNEFLANYDRFLRGTKCVENRTRVFLGWDDVLAQGYLLNVQIAYSSDQPLIVPVQFSMLLAKPPLDLSTADAPLYTPTDAQPWTYRSFEGDDYLEELPEYIANPGDTEGGIRATPYRYIAENGEATTMTSPDENVPVAHSVKGSASWLTGNSPGRKQWNSEDEALMKLNGHLTSQQTGADLVTTIQALRKDPAAFQFSNRDSTLLRVLASLGQGVSNAAAVVSDPPDLG